MMGKPLLDTAAIDAAVVTKTTGNLLVLPEDHPLLIKSQLSMQAIRLQAKSACIQCRMCTDLCPRYLLGHQIRPHLVMRNLWREALISEACPTRVSAATPPGAVGESVRRQPSGPDRTADRAARPEPLPTCAAPPVQEADARGGIHPAAAAHR